MNKTDTLYGTEDQERLDESVEEVIQDLLDGLDEGETAKIGWPIKVIVYRRVDLSKQVVRLADIVLADLLERLDEDNSDPDGDGTEPTATMRQAARQFVSAVLAEYVPWACEPTGEVIEVTREQAKEMA